MPIFSISSPIRMVTHSCSTVTYGIPTEGSSSSRLPPGRLHSRQLFLPLFVVVQSPRDHVCDVPPFCSPCPPFFSPCPSLSMNPLGHVIRIFSHLNRFVHLFMRGHLVRSVDLRGRIESWCSAEQYGYQLRHINKGRQGL
jgi:hypothetical protein